MNSSKSTILSLLSVSLATLVAWSFLDSHTRAAVGSSGNSGGGGGGDAGGTNARGYAISGTYSNMDVRSSGPLALPLNIWGQSGQANDLLHISSPINAPLFVVDSNGCLFGDSGLGPKLMDSSTVGYVWTATGVNGRGAWQANAGTVAGSPYQLQYNSNSAFAASKIFTVDPLNHHIIVSNNNSFGGTSLRLAGDSGKYLRFTTGNPNYIESDSTITVYLGGSAIYGIAANGIVLNTSNSASFGDWANPGATGAFHTVFASIYNARTATVLGVGGANTNFTLTADMGHIYASGQTNVSIRAIMGTLSDRVAWPKLVITNLTGTARTLEFSSVTNRWRFSGVYGTNAPNTITNDSRLELSFECHGTNTTVTYAYFNPGL